LADFEFVIAHWLSPPGFGLATAIARRPIMRRAVSLEAPIAGQRAFPQDGGPAYNHRMATRRLNEPIEPMTLGNMRANGVRSLDVLGQW
jgi:hypothetical protein